MGNPNSQHDSVKHSPTLELSPWACSQWWHEQTWANGYKYMLGVSQICGPERDQKLEL